MGEVYRAKDTRLERTVALKVLPEEFFENKESIARFEREARMLASAEPSQHRPSLFLRGDPRCTRAAGAASARHGAGRGTDAPERLANGPLPPEQLLKVSIEIAAALDAAHHAGIIHRDLKPGNVMLTKSGVKLLDFGLAKTALPPVKSSSATSLPTEMPRAITQQGTILGTFQYMAPEQLEGKEADARSDIFSFGAVLYEMATGRKAFDGKSQAALISAILKDEPASVAAVAPMTPPALDRVVKTCLAKDPEDRFQTAHDIRLQLQWIAEGGSQVGLPAPVAHRRKSRERLAWSLAAAAAVAAAVLAVGFVRRAPARPKLVRFEIANPEGITTIDAPRISPDGRHLAFNAIDSSGKSRIWVRPLNALVAQPLAGTEGTTRPFWSPDSRFLGFFAEGKLKKVEVSGGPPQKICDAPRGSDGSWSREGVILFDGTGTDPIYRVPAAGGTPVVAVKPDASRKETTVAWPEFLPDGRHFLYMASGREGGRQRLPDRLARLDRVEAARAGADARHLRAARLSPLRARQDARRPALRREGPEDDRRADPAGRADRDGQRRPRARSRSRATGPSSTGPGETGDRILWVDRSGKEGETVGDPGEYHNPAFSPAATGSPSTSPIRAAGRPTSGSGT